MRYLKIQNDGVLDIRLVALMGGTTKANDQYKIGQFGTGLKYTFAFLFRNNLDFRVFAGDEEVQFAIETEVIREEKFEIICINGHRTSITTKMGQDWMGWMILRELWCNALDEGGAIKDITTDVRSESGKTIFYIQIDQQIQEVLDNWGKYFIHDVEPMYNGAEYAIYPGGPSLKLYKNGVLIREVDHLPAVFAYDIKGASLNELREFHESPGYGISMALAKANERVATYFLENVTARHYEGSDMSFDWWQTWGEAWANVLGNVKLIHQEAKDNIEARGISIDVGELIVVPKNVFKSLTKQFQRVSALSIASKAGEFYRHISPESENVIKIGLTILEKCGYPMHPELNFVYGYFEDKGILSKVNIDEKIVYISNTILQLPLIEVVAILIQENEHFNTGFTDCSRQFQDHFITLYAQQLLKTNSIKI